MLNGRGLIEVRKMLHQIGRMVDELTKRGKPGTDADLATILAEQQSALAELGAANQRLLAAKAELANARQGLDASFESARRRYYRGRSWVYAKYGTHATTELAAFGLLPPPEFRRGRRTKTAPAPDSRTET